MAKTVKVNIVLDAATALLNLSRLAVSAGKDAVEINKLQRTLAQLNGQMGGTARTAGLLSNSILRGVGSFYLLHRGLQISGNLLRQGISTAMEFEHAMALVGVTTHATGEELQALRQKAQIVGAKLGPINTIDILRGMSGLKGLRGMTNARLYNMTDLISTIVSNMVDISYGAVSPQEGFVAIKEMLGTAGGVPNKAYATSLLNAMHGAVLQYGQSNPIELLRGARNFIPLAKNLGIPPDQIAALAAWRFQNAIGGARSAGRDIEALFTGLLHGAGGVGGRKGNSAKRAAAAASFFGFGDAELKNFMNPTGADVVRMIDTVQQRSQSLRLGGPAERVKFQNFLKDWLGTQLGTRAMRLLASSGDTLKDILDQIKKSLSPNKMVKLMLETTKGQWEQFKENLQILGGEIFGRPNSALWVLLDRLNKATFGLIKISQTNTLANRAMGWGTVVGTAGFGLGALAAFGRGVVGLRTISGIAGLLSGGGLIAGFLMLLVGGGIALYKSKWLGLNSMQLADVIINMINKALKLISDKIGVMIPLLPSAMADYDASVKQYKQLYHNAVRESFANPGTSVAMAAKRNAEDMKEHLRELRGKYRTPDFIGRGVKGKLAQVFDSFGNAIDYYDHRKPRKMGQNDPDTPEEQTFRKGIATPGHAARQSLNRKNVGDHISDVLDEIYARHQRNTLAPVGGGRIY